ncbi:MAG: hypothetical protein U0518_05280 [Candidatus Gracilibacteria bacterium]
MSGYMSDELKILNQHMTTILHHQSSPEEREGAARSLAKSLGFGSQVTDILLARVARPLTAGCKVELIYMISNAHSAQVSSKNIH